MGVMPRGSTTLRFLRVRFPVEQRLSVGRVRPGMQFTRDVFTRSGRKIAEAGSRVTDVSLDRLRRFSIPPVEVRRFLRGWIAPNRLQGFPCGVDILEDRVIRNSGENLGRVLEKGSTASLLEVLRMARRRAHAASRMRWVHAVTSTLRRCNRVETGETNRNAPDPAGENHEEDGNGGVVDRFSDLCSWQGPRWEQNRAIARLNVRFQVTDIIVRMASGDPRVLQPRVDGNREDPSAPGTDGGLGASRNDAPRGGRTERRREPTEFGEGTGIPEERVETLVEAIHTEYGDEEHGATLAAVAAGRRPVDLALIHRIPPRHECARREGLSSGGGTVRRPLGGRGPRRFAVRNRSDGGRTR